METNFEQTNPCNDFLSQSYCNGIQRLVGNKDKILNVFQIPSNIVEQRIKIWNNLFKKYSPMVSEIEFNIMTLNPNEQTVKKHISMRKSISMIQFWVDTGYQPYTEYFNDRTYSGSSFTDKFIKSTKILNFEVPDECSRCPEKYSKINETSFNKCLKLATSYSSSINTTDYILANNNTTTKADTIAIVEGSKTNDKKQVHKSSFKSTSENCNANKYFKDTNTYQQNIIDRKLILNRGNSCKYILFNKNNNDLQNVNLEQNNIITTELIQGKNNDYTIFCTKSNFKNMDTNFRDLIHKKNVNRNSKNNNNCLGLFSESDESIIKNKYYNSQTKDNTCKILNRKKLYNNTESLVEFTPESESNSIFYNLNFFKQYEHPVLYTSKFNSKPHLVKYHRLERNKKYNRHLLFSSMSLKTKKKNKYELLESNQNDNIFKKSNRLQNQYFKQNKVNFQSNFKEGWNKNYKNSNIFKIISTENNSDCNIFNKIVNHSVKNAEVVQNEQLNVLESLNITNHYMNNQFKLKDFTINLHRLPYTYEHPNFTTNTVHVKQINNQGLIQTNKISKTELINENNGFTNFIVKKQNSFKTFKTCTEKESNIDIKSNYVALNNVQNRDNYNNVKNSFTDKIMTIIPTEELKIKKTSSKKSEIISQLEKPISIKINECEYNCKSSLISSHQKRKIYDISFTSSSDEDIFISKTKRQFKKKNSVIVNNQSLKLQKMSRNKNVTVSSKRKRNIIQFNNKSFNENNLQTSIFRNMQHNKNSIILDEQINTKKAYNKNKLLLFNKNNRFNQSFHKLTSNEKLISSINKKQSNYNLILAPCLQNIPLKDIKPISISKQKNNYNTLKFSDKKNLYNQNKRVFLLTQNKQCINNKGNNVTNKYFCNFKQINTIRLCNQESNEDKIKKNEILSIKSEQNGSNVHMSSDEECIIPLKLK